MLRPLIHRHDPQVREPERQRGEVPRILELARLPRHAIVGRTPGEVEKDPYHARESPSGVISARKMSSSRRPLRAGRLATMSATVPSATVCPAFITSTRVQISSTRWSRCEDRKSVV